MIFITTERLEQCKAMFDKYVEYMTRMTLAARVVSTDEIHEKYSLTDEEMKMAQEYLEYAYPIDKENPATKLPHIESDWTFY